ncbi:hypothetical protein CO2235_U770032 [Cupriavidus oxalaticus]|uniref:Uncharacterized protein n=1 Tax=Cupriavidus oxalaticus TaxID=96344 RepID=A0A375FQJ9_9BURK|nr:hypothetical protein CO2235_U770032 [Cupriavidus oxalaticus]
MIPSACAAFRSTLLNPVQRSATSLVPPRPSASSTVASARSLTKMHTAPWPGGETHCFTVQGGLEVSELMAFRRIRGIEMLTIVGLCAEDGDFHNVSPR